MKKDDLIKVALADDHILLRNALASLIDRFENCKVVMQVSNGKELSIAISKDNLPDVVLLDLNMPEMNGFETATWLRDHYPSIHVLMLTMYDSELTLIRLLQAGVKGFLKKDIHPNELKYAIHAVIEHGYYYSHNATGKLLNLFRINAASTSILDKSLLTEVEIKFLQLSSSELTYKEIAQEMKLNPRGVDNLRDNLFTKLEVKSRVGLAMYAIRHGLVNI
ncbi:MAG TPA: response regulator transcription factor [Chitinophagaceae bacterium]